MELEKQVENKPLRDENGRLLPGNTANPNGRPKGKTIKERIREWLEEHPNDMQAFVDHFVKNNRDLAWQMLEGRPAQATDLTSNGKTINIVVPQAVADAFNIDESNKETGGSNTQ